MLQFIFRNGPLKIEHLVAFYLKNKNKSEIKNEYNYLIKMGYIKEENGIVNINNPVFLN